MNTNKPFKRVSAITWLTAIATLGLGISGATAAQQQEIPVLVTLADPVDLAGVRIFSDGLGTYSQDDAQVKSFIGLGGQLRFHTYDSPTRSVKVDFTRYVGVTGALPFTYDRLVQGNILTLGEDTEATDGKEVLTAKQLDPGAKGERFDLLKSTFLVGQTRRIGLQLTFPIKEGKTTKNWRIRWGGGEKVGDATTGLVTVKRLSQNRWMIYADDTSKDLAAIGIANEPPVGVYSMPFCLVIQKP